MSSMGTCPHNNVQSYCVTCAREKAFGRKGNMRKRAMHGWYDDRAFAPQMGLSLQDLWDSATKGAQAGISAIAPSALASVVQTAAGDTAVQQQLQASAASQAAANVMKNKWVWVGAGVGVLLLVYLMGKKG